MGELDPKKFATIQDLNYANALKRIAELEEVVKAVAHIGIDWGYGEFALEQSHIDKARELYEATLKQPDSREQAE